MLLYALTAMAVFVAAKCREKIFKLVLSLRAKPSTLRPATAKGHRNIQTLLTYLQNDFKALRVGVYQFHNGSSFMCSNHAWKVSMTHEATGPQILPTLMAFQSIPASGMMDWVDPLLNHDYYPDGMSIIDTCQSDAAARCTYGKLGYRVMHFDIARMRVTVGKVLAQECGVTQMYMVPLCDPQTHAVFGFLALHFGDVFDTMREDVESRLCAICPVAEQIQFYLTTEFERYAKDTRPWWRRVFE